MEENSIPLKDDSSFEILSNSDDDDMVTASMYSSIQSSAFESLNSSFILECLTEGAKNENFIETNCDTIEKQTFCDKLKDTRLSSDPSTKHLGNSDDAHDQAFNTEKILSLSWVDEISCNEIIPSSEVCEICSLKNPSVNEKQTFCDELKDTRLSSDPSTKHLGNSNDAHEQAFNSQKVLSLSWVDEISYNEMIPPNAECKICSLKNPSVTEIGLNNHSPEISEEIIGNQKNEKTKNYFRTNKISDCISTIDHSTYAIDMEQRQFDPTRDIATLDPKRRHCTVKRLKNSATQTSPDRDDYSLNSCSLMKHSFRICRSISENKYVQNLISGVKSSFHYLLTTLDMEMNPMTGMKDPLNILIAAEISDSLAIEEAFYQSFRGHVIVSNCPEMIDTDMPILPVGYNSAMLVAQSKINKARQLLDSGKNAVIVSTTKFVVEVYPQRWQLSTILCLEDHNLFFNLHNFTATIPVPNDYILEAQRLTPRDYPFKNMGFAVTLEQVLYCRIDNIDLEEILCGVHHLINLQSAARILASTYSKYVNRHVQ